MEGARRSLNSMAYALLYAAHGQRTNNRALMSWPMRLTGHTAVFRLWLPSVRVSMDGGCAAVAPGDAAQPEWSQLRS